MPYEEEPSYDDFRQHESYPAIKAALDKVRMRAILLIIVELLNIPGAFFWALTERRHIMSSCCLGMETLSPV